jgi:hemerythrin-like metal-binding protein
MWTEFIGGDDFPALGDAALDEEHRGIAKAMNQLHLAVASEKPVGEQRSILQQFETYFRVNCRKEEMMMEHDSYPNAATHGEAHQTLYKRIELLNANIAAGRPALAIENLKQIRMLLIDHVTKADSLIAAWHRIHCSFSESPAKEP